MSYIFILCLSWLSFYRLRASLSNPMPSLTSTIPYTQQVSNKHLAPLMADDKVINKQQKTIGMVGSKSFLQMKKKLIKSKIRDFSQSQNAVFICLLFWIKSEKLRLASYSLSRQGQPWMSPSSCLHYLCVGITSI